MRLMTWVIEQPETTIVDNLVSKMNALCKSLGWSDPAITSEGGNTYVVDVEAFAELVSFLPSAPPTSQQYEQLTLF